MKQSFLRKYTGTVTFLVTTIGYFLVTATLYSDWLNFLFPKISLASVNFLSHAIAVNNALAIICLVSGWYWIRSGDVKKHPRAMITGFILIIIFLVMYLLKTGGGGRKEFIGPAWAWWSYISMLGVHILLSILSVPLVIHTLLLGLSNPIEDVRNTSHSRIGTWAAVSWIISLSLGLIAYLMLNHFYNYHFVPA
ncbi:MAG: DUF420 domain-containing protein [bacterium]